jgi:hypothetical protein
MIKQHDMALRILYFVIKLIRIDHDNLEELLYHERKI